MAISTHLELVSVLVRDKGSGKALPYVPRRRKRTAPIHVTPSLPRNVPRLGYPSRHQLLGVNTRFFHGALAADQRKRAAQIY